MKVARLAGEVVVVDIVPHEILTTMPLAEYMSWIPDTTAIVATNETMLQMAGLDSEGAHWHSAETVITASALDWIKDRFELVVCVLDSRSVEATLEKVAHRSRGIESGASHSRSVTTGRSNCTVGH